MVHVSGEVRVFLAHTSELFFCRLINESLYKSVSSQASKMMKEDPRIFEDV